MNNMCGGFWIDLRIFLSFLERSVVPPVLCWLRIRGDRKKSRRLLKLCWLDEETNSVVMTIKKETNGVSVSPKINNTYKSEITRIPAVNLYHFQGVQCCVRSSSVVCGNKLILERVPDCDPTISTYATGYIKRHGVRIASIERGKSGDHLDRGIFLGGNGAANYYHWMIEIAPKLEFISQLGPEFSEYPLLVDEHVMKTPNFLYALDHLKPLGSRKIVALTSDTVYSVESLLYITSPAFLPFNIRGEHPFSVNWFLFRTESITFLRDKFLQGQEMEGFPARKRIFLARRPHRRCYNQDEVFTLFEKYGFKKVFLEDYNVPSQIGIVANAEMIAGPTGAAWTNLIFCKTGTKCLCWMSEKTADFSAFSSLAAIAGVNLSYVLYPACSSITTEALGCEYRISPEKLEKELINLISGGSPTL